MFLFFSFQFYWIDTFRINEFSVSKTTMQINNNNNNNNST